MIYKSADNFAGLKVGAVRAGGVGFVKAANFHFAFSLAQISCSVGISRFAPLAGFKKFTAGFAVRAAAADFLFAAHEITSLREHVHVLSPNYQIYYIRF